MKARFFIAALLVAGATFGSLAQGYKDGIEFYKIDDLDNAKELLMRNLNDAQTDKAEAYYYLGQIALHQNNVSEAASYFDKGLAANPNNPYNLIGQAAVALKNGGNASELVNKARKMLKKNCALETEIARMYYDVDPVKYVKDIEKCVKQARKWNVTDPTVSNFEGDRYADQRQWGDAAGCYESAFTNDVDNVEAYVKYADAYFNVNPTYAIDRLREIIGKVPNSALVQRQLAEKLYENGDLTNAAQQYGSYINNTKNHFSKDEARYCQLLLFAGDYNKCYDVATNLRNNVQATDDYAFVAERLRLYSLAAGKRWEEAAKVGDEFMKMKNSKMNFEANDYIFYAQALDKVGRGADAVDAYDNAMRLDPDNIDLVRGLSRSNKAAKDFDKAILYAKKVLDKTGREADDLYDAADIYYEQSKTLADDAKLQAVNQAIALIDEALAKDQSSISYLYRKALIEREKDTDKDKSNAVNTYKRLVDVITGKGSVDEFKPYLKVAYNYIGTHYFNVNNKTEGLAAFKKWYEVDPDNTSLRDFIQSMEK